MKTLYFDFYDESRKRHVPVGVYLSETLDSRLPTVIFSPGYQGQEDIKKEELFFKKYTYLAEYFTTKGYAFITVQHDILGDNDGLETVDPKAIQDEARRHLYIRAEANILLAISQLKQQKLPLILDNFILGGHSNGGDIAKYFAGLYPKMVRSLVLFDARRAKLRPQLPLSVLMFEADDTTTDIGVIAEPDQNDNKMRANLDLIIIKPRDALHASYIDDEITEQLKNKILAALDWFLEGRI